MYSRRWLFHGDGGDAAIDRCSTSLDSSRNLSSVRLLALERVVSIRARCSHCRRRCNRRRSIRRQSQERGAIRGDNFLSLCFDDCLVNDRTDRRWISSPGVKFSGHTTTCSHEQNQCRYATHTVVLQEMSVNSVLRSSSTHIGQQMFEHGA